MTKPDYALRAADLVNGTGTPRTRSQLLSEVEAALARAFDAGAAAGRTERDTAPKLGAVYALEQARDELQKTIDRLRRDIEERTK
jgi:hypothetical protein